MKTLITQNLEAKHFHKKEEWTKGEWDDEPDVMEWCDKKTNHRCLIVRNPMGSLCGYVGVNSSHKYFEVDHEDIDYIGIHGGLTYSSDMYGYLYNIAERGHHNVWWFGFDCSHTDDFTPSISIGLGRSGRTFSGSHQTYRNFDYVKSECERLAQQLKQITDN